MPSVRGRKGRVIGDIVAADIVFNTIPTRWLLLVALDYAVSRLYAVGKYDRTFRMKHIWPSGMRRGCESVPVR
jgi:hypothetical protein